MLLSRAEMKYFLEKTTIHIEIPSNEKKNSNDRYERSFAELLCMGSGDLACGYRMKEEVKAKAVKMHSKAISSVILSILADHKPGYKRTDHEVLSWDRLKKKKLWLKIGIRIGSKEIRRLDWVIHEQIVSDGESTKRWIDSIDRWEAFLIKDEEYESSDMEYDDNYKIWPDVTKNADEKQRNIPEKRPSKCILC